MSKIFKSKKLQATENGTKTTGVANQKSKVCIALFIQIFNITLSNKFLSFSVENVYYPMIKMSSRMYYISLYFLQYVYDEREIGTK